VANPLLTAAARASLVMATASAILLLNARPAAADEAAAAQGVPDPSISRALGPLADPGGIRASLATRGVTYGVNYIGEFLSNTTGGIERGSIYDGRVELFIDADLEKVVGWKGLSFHINGYQIQGEGITATKVGNFNALSNIEARATTRLFELWLEQKLLDDRLSVRFGQLGVDSEFIISDTTNTFISSAFGWPTLPTVTLPSGGVAYPFASPAVRVQFAPSKQFAIRAGVYDDNPAGPGVGDPQLRNRHGLNFRISDYPYVIGEIEHKHGQDAHGSLLPGTVKVGAWTDLAKFDDLRRGSDGLSLADPASDGRPERHRGDQSFYVVLDQQVYQLPNATSGNGVSVFARFMGAPSDRNLVDFEIDAGAVFTGLMRDRPSDSFGVAASWAQVSNDAKALDEDFIRFGSSIPIRQDEVLLEATYIAQVLPGWTVQPDFQYVWNPGGNVLNDDGSLRKNAAVFGIRTSINY
jgi:porin